MLLFRMCFFEEKHSYHNSACDNHRTYKIREEVWEAIPNGAWVEYAGIILGLCWSREGASECWTEYGSEKKRLLVSDVVCDRISTPEI